MLGDLPDQASCGRPRASSRSARPSPRPQPWRRTAPEAPRHPRPECNAVLQIMQCPVTSRLLPLLPLPPLLSSIVSHSPPLAAPFCPQLSGQPARFGRRRAVRRGGTGGCGQETPGRVRSRRRAAAARAARSRSRARSTVDARATPGAATTRSMTRCRSAFDRATSRTIMSAAASDRVRLEHLGDRTTGAAATGSWPPAPCAISSVANADTAKPERRRIHRRRPRR